MANVDDIKAAIEALPEPDFAILRHWFSEKDWEKWDRELESDSQAGRLDFLVQEALDERKQGSLREL